MSVITSLEHSEVKSRFGVSHFIPLPLKKCVAGYKRDTKGGGVDVCSTLARPGLTIRREVSRIVVGTQRPFVRPYRLSRLRNEFPLSRKCSIDEPDLTFRLDFSHFLANIMTIG